MTAVRNSISHVSIYCDTPSCPHAYGEWDTTTKQIRDVAAELGWSHADGADYCPEHRKTKPKGTTK